MICFNLQIKFHCPPPPGAPPPNPPKNCRATNPMTI